MQRLKLFSRISITVWMAFLAVGLFITPPVLAATPAQQACEGAGGTWSSGACSKAGSSSLVETFQRIISVLLFLIGFGAVIMIIIGGIRLVFSAGSEDAVKGAKSMILYAVIGLIVAILAYAIVRYVFHSVIG